MLQRLTWLLAGTFWAVSLSRAAEDNALAEIRALLAPMRATPPGATPVLTDVKHKLRDWIESRLREFRNEDDVHAFAQELNAEILRAKLSCDWAATPDEEGCPARAHQGYLGEIKLDLGQVLVVTTAVGIDCRFDESAYTYSLSNGRWKRFWQSETNDYGEGKYVPLNFLGIQLSPQDYLDDGTDPNVRLLLLLARDPAYCESNWYNVYYRVWQLRIDQPEERLLLDKGEEAFLGDWVDGSVSARDVLIEFATRTQFTDFQLRRVVRHYALNDGELERVDPLALSPRDFADEWMRTEWQISSDWTGRGASASSLRQMHRKQNFEGGQYASTIRCEKRPEHWQVGLVWDKFDGKTIVETKHMYFLVRWRAPYRFWMTGVREHPWPGCTEKDLQADEPRTLFPIHLQQSR